MLEGTEDLVLEEARERAASAAPPVLHDGDVIDVGSAPVVESVDDHGPDTEDAGDSTPEGVEPAGVDGTGFGVGRDTAASEDAAASDDTAASEDSAAFEDSVALQDSAAFEDSVALQDSAAFEDSVALQDSAAFEDSAAQFGFDAIDETAAGPDGALADFEPSDADSVSTIADSAVTDPEPSPGASSSDRLSFEHREPSPVEPTVGAFDFAQPGAGSVESGPGTFDFASTPAETIAPPAGEGSKATPHDADDTAPDNEDALAKLVREAMQRAVDAARGNDS